MKKFEEMRALMASHKRSQPAFADMFEAAMDAWLDKHSPARRHARRMARREARPKTGPARRETPTLQEKPRSRHIPAATRDAVVARHGGRCGYVGPSGRRCGATRHLQVDHVTPFARGGTHDTGNLRLLCAEHNRLEAERLLGRDVMAPHCRE